MLKRLVHIDDFFQDTTSMLYAIDTSNYVKTDFGYEIPEFNLVTPGIAETFSTILNEKVSVDEGRSGIFRKPSGFIHFESFDSINDWCFVVAIKETTFNTFEHASGAKCALDEYRLNYNNLFDWELKSNIVLYPNNGLFFRPWMFHSFQGGILHIYYLKGAGYGI